MDSLYVKTIKFERKQGVRKYNQMRRLTNVFRVVEICVVLIILSRFTSQLPTAAKLSGAYFRDLSLVVASPRFVFLLGNAIVITLFIKSGKFSSTQDADKKKAESDANHELTDISGKKNQKTDRAEYKKQSGPPEEQITQVNTYAASLDMKIYRRSRSENLNHEKPRRELRRTVTDNCIKNICSGGEEEVEKRCPEDDMSNEEFKHKIEAFIARQQRILREDYSAFVH